MTEVILRNLIVSKDGTQIRRDGNLLKIVPESGDTLHFSPHTLRQVIVSCEASISTGAMRLLNEENVDLVIVGHRPKNIFLRMVSEDSNIITDVWLAQINLPEERKLYLAKRILEAALDNKVSILRYLSRNRGVSLDLDDLLKVKDEIESAASDMELMGYEGEGARKYFQMISGLLPEEYGFRGRNKHPPLDPLNAMLSYGYTVLASRVEYALMLSGLNPHVGVLHRAYRNRKSLTYDLVEEFRQPVIDRIVFSLAGHRQIKPEDFRMEKGMCMMDEAPKRMLLDGIYTALESDVAHEGKRMEMMDVIYEQANRLKDAIVGSKEYRGFKWRF